MSSTENDSELGAALLSDLDLPDETSAATENANRYLENLADNPWGLSPKALTAKQAAMRSLSTKTGLYARIPITCKGDACPYAETCSLLPYDLAPEGEYCPVEISQVEALVQGYYRDFDLDEMSFTDRSLVNEIVFLDIILERCRGLMAKEGTPVTEILIGMTDHGEEIRQPNVSRAWETYEKVTKRKDQKLQLLMATRNMKMKMPQEEKQTSWIDAINATVSEEDLAAAVAAEKSTGTGGE